METECEAFILVKQVFPCPSKVKESILVPTDRFLWSCSDYGLLLGGYNFSYPSAGRGLLDVN
jgi:hypothetical protein